MRNCLFEVGDDLIVTLPYAVTSGQGVLVGRIFGFATTTNAIGVRANIRRKGVFTHAKATGAGTNWADGALVYWDNAARLITGVASGNTAIGFGYGAAAVGDTSGAVVLTPQ